MGKIRMALRLLFSKNYLVICDRHSAATVKHMFIDSFRKEMKKIDKKLAEEIKLVRNGDIKR